MKQIATCMLILMILMYPSHSAYAGSLEFDGVAVDITTDANEDLVITPGTGGNRQDQPTK